eukprot:COSAG02_NODE_1521_length_12162_cov_3.464147_5_plen_179_part_00
MQHLRDEICGLVRHRKCHSVQTSQLLDPFGTARQGTKHSSSLVLGAARKPSAGVARVQAPSPDPSTPAASPPTPPSRPPYSSSSAIASIFVTKSESIFEFQPGYMATCIRRPDCCCDNNGPPWLVPRARVVCAAPARRGAALVARVCAVDTSVVAQSVRAEAYRQWSPCWRIIWWRGC